MCHLTLSELSSYSTIIYTVLTALNVGVFIWYTIHQASRTAEFDKPFVSFFKVENQGTYFIQNIGKGAALNVRIYAKNSDERKIDGQWNINVVWGTIPGNSNQENMFDTGSVSHIYAEYADRFGNVYYSYMHNDILQVFPANRKEKKKTFSDELVEISQPKGPVKRPKTGHHEI